MKKRLPKAMGIGVAFALLLSAQPLAANCCNNWRDPCGDREVGAHALYRAPIACPYVYVIRNTPTVEDRRTINPTSSVKCNADRGFRVFGRYVSDCSFVGLGHQWFESKSASTSVNTLQTIPGGISINLEPTRVTERTSVEYQKVDVRFGRYLHHSCDCNFYIFGNARWVDLSNKRSIRHLAYIPSSQEDYTQQAREESELQGGALGVGAGSEFSVGCNFGLFGDANLLGIIGDRKTKNVQFQMEGPLPTTILRNPSSGYLRFRHLRRSRGRLPNRHQLHVRLWLLDSGGRTRL
jgi:Legionella pneumophila major outer membrane protein precursor